MRQRNAKFQKIAQKVTNSTWFNMSILVVIFINALLIGVQTYDDIPNYVQYIQLFILFIFFIELILRWLGRASTQEYLSDWWNYFDVLILVVGIIPEVADIMVVQEQNDNSIFATLRVLRIIQITRSVRAIEDLRVLIAVLLKSIRSLTYIALLFVLVMYIYAIVGVTLFKNRDYQNSEHLELTASNPDPYGDISEAFFTLFRVLTGEDWTDLRYNLLKNEFTQNGDGRESVPASSNFVVTFYHVSWMIIAAYLLMNLVVGAIVNNFQLVLDAQKAEEEDDDNQLRDREKKRIIKRPKTI